ncbi:phosphotransferase [Saccharothrix violaceirubra]|uniref:Aminoglycoside phosphotransferase domain-containing protein n=1 Tax=Saccharothrix violaceirubra TaxID=413306 RepID=A0A7W7WTZ0_9PSEU|nr:phosphotransferase [Saccharothrix violaceirubra]MBB4963646.1 hypothetical protein [Saccharothrix violaceirubra]
MRRIRALVTVGGEFVGAAPDFDVESFWLNATEDVVAHLEAVLGVPVSVLRLERTTEARRSGDLVVYQVEAEAMPRVPLDRSVDHDFPDHPLRVPWARPGGPRSLVEWADRHVTRTGPAVQVKTWHLSCVYRLPTDRGPVWAKAFPGFVADEAAVIALVREVDPTLVPEVIASEPGRVLLADVPGEDCWNPTPEVIADVVPRLVAVQHALAGPARSRVRGIDVPDFGLPDTLLHGDFHPGNWRSSGVVLDWADAHWGNPALDVGRLLGFVDPASHPLIERTWADAWLAHRPDSDPHQAIRHGRHASHLLGALVYQDFLDHIEPSERVYHEGDPAAERAKAQASLP